MVSHLALHQPFDGFGGRLFDDGDLVPRLHQPRQIIIRSVIRHSGKRNPPPIAHFARSDDDLPNFAHDKRVVVKGFVKVAETKEYNRFGELFLDCKILAADRGCHRGK